MNLFARLRTIWHATFARIHGTTHAERLEEYYCGQAQEYDGFREHLLHGRPRLLKVLPVEAGARVVEFGAGTGWNIEALGERRARCRSVVLVDLCPSLLRVAQERMHRLGWTNVTLCHGDAAAYRPEDG